MLKKFDLKKLIIGTANFGQKYGLKKNKINHKEILKILNHSYKVGIKTIDTAINYGTSESVITKYRNKNKNWKIISKIPKIPKKIQKIDIYINRIINKSIKNLNLKTLHGILIHNPDDLLNERGHEIYQSLLKIKKKGLIKKIGVSIYNFEQINILTEKYKLDIIQVPFNLIDRRLLNKKNLKNLKDRKIEIHARSIFLKGLLLQEKLPKKFGRYNHLWSMIDKFKKENNTNSLELCLNFIKKYQLVDRFIIGIDNLEHLKEIIKILRSNKSIKVPFVKSNDKKLIDPTQW